MSKKSAHSHFSIRKAHSGKGHGLFASKDLRKGTFILEYTGKKIPSKAADAMKSRYLFELDSRWTIDGSPRSNIARYINHACEPNCECELDGGHINIYAARKIKKGEELSFDYGKEYFDEFIKPVGCKCLRCLKKRGGPSAESLPMRSRSRVRK